jgi:mannosidase alpha-like ER degradation enhancer 3
MHQPGRQSKSHIDSLLAFWPGLQVLKGDIKGAITMHETLNQIVKRYDFLPEAVLFDHSAHVSLLYTLSDSNTPISASTNSVLL